MRDTYLTEINLSRRGSDEVVIAYRLRVDRYDCKPFSFAYRRISGKGRQIFWNSSPNYYNLGVAVKRMRSRATRDLLEDSSLYISAMNYEETAIIVANLPDFYEVLPNGKVRQVR